MALLSLLAAGLGQFAYARPGRGLVFLLLDVLFLVCVLELAIHVKEEPANLVLAGGVFAAWRLFATVDALRLRSGERGGVFVGVLAAAAVWGAGGWTAANQALLPLRATGAHMDPALRKGELFLCDRLAYRFGELARGDVVVYRAGGSTLAKRVVGLPGERIEIRNGRVFADGIEVPEPYARGRNAAMKRQGPIDVPEETYLLLWDDRSAPQHPTPVERKKILGRAALVVTGRPGTRIR